MRQIVRFYVAVVGLALLYFFSSLCPSRAQVVHASDDLPVPFDEVVEILKPREVDVELLGAAEIPPAIQEVMLRFRMGVTKHKDWFLNAVKEASGKLPYDERMEITEREYQQLMSYLESEVQVGPIGRGRIRFERSEDGKQVKIANIEGVPQLDGIVIDVPSQELRTKWGHTKNLEHVHANKEQRATGPWEAFGWRMKEGAIERGNYTTIQFSVGRHLASGKSLIDIRAIAIRPDHEPEKAEAFVRFD